MKKPKYKVFDILHVKDEQDEAYKYNSLYEVIAIIEEGYVLKSLRFKQVILPEELKRVAEATHSRYMTCQDFIEQDYRLATEEEIELGPQKIPVDY